MPTEEEDGFVYMDRARSAAEAVSRHPHGRELSIVKSAIQAYISRWLLPDTFQNKLLLDHAPQLSRYVQNREGSRNVYFNTDQSWDEVDETNTRRVQVARFMSSLGRKLPSILIVDGGYNNITAGLGDIQGGRMVGSHAYNFDVVTCLTVNIDIVIVSEDDTTCNDLCTLVTSTIGPPLRRFGNGNHITGSDTNSSYQITLPLSNNVGAMSKESMGDDPVDAMYMASTSVEVSYDGTSTLRSSVPVRRGLADISSEGGMSIEHIIDGHDLRMMVSIDGPAAVTGMKPARYAIRVPPSGTEVMLKPEWRLSTTDHRIATIDPKTMILRPKRPGTVFIKLIDRDNTVLTSTEVVIS